MKKKYTAHIISHTHWDREWYMSYERHHMYLIELMDQVLDLVKSKGYNSFNMDGHTLPIHDYIQVRPEKSEEVLHAIRQGKIKIGPWFILQDAFLVEGESHVRNMQIGQLDAKRLGGNQKIGYFPDTFGIMGQAPQMMRKSGIDNAFFGRGVKPTGFANVVIDDDFTSTFSEMFWEGPDGSKILGILFANWYSNGTEIPSDIDQSKKYWDSKLADAAKYASTSQLLFMNGSDHQPAQKDIVEAIRIANIIYDDVEFVHSSLEEYVEAVKKELPDTIGTVKGELRSQETDGFGTLINTASSRLYLKKANHLAQTALIRKAEPLATMILDKKQYPFDQFVYAWKLLMENHTHDAICGCSVDEVHQENMTRFMKANEVADYIAEETLILFQQNVDTQKLQHPFAFTIFNTSGYQRRDIARVEVDIARVYYKDSLDLEADKQSLKELELPSIVYDKAKKIACSITDLGVVYDYDLPKDAFRAPYHARRILVEFCADLPAFSWKTYGLDYGEAENSTVKQTDIHVIENEYYKITCHAEDGRIDMFAKSEDKLFEDFLYYEDSGDMGNEYVFFETKGRERIYSKGVTLENINIENTPVTSTIHFEQTLHLPVSAAKTLIKEQQEYIWFTQRSSTRADETVAFCLTTTITLHQGVDKILIDSKFNNQVRDHRLRLCLASGVLTDHVFVDSVFEIVKRATKKPVSWINPDFSQHQSAFVNIPFTDEEKGFTVMNKGLPEYEYLPDGDVAITIMRSIGELGDWGYFPTPDAQCLGTFETSIGIAVGRTSNTYKTGYQFQSELYGIQVPTLQLGNKEHTKQFLTPSIPDDVYITSLYRSLMSHHINCRLFNTGDEGMVELEIPRRICKESDLIGNTMGSFNKTISPYEIKTVRLVTKKEGVV